MGKRETPWQELDLGLCLASIKLKVSRSTKWASHWNKYLQKQTFVQKQTIEGFFYYKIVKMNTDIIWCFHQMYLMVLWSRRWGKTKILSGKQLNFWIQSLCAKVSELVQLKYFLTEQIKMTFSTDLLLCPFFLLCSQLYPTSFCFSPNDLCSLHGTKCLLLTAFLFQSLIF